MKTLFRRVIRHGHLEPERPNKGETAQDSTQSYLVDDDIRIPAFLRRQHNHISDEFLESS